MGAVVSFSDEARLDLAWWDYQEMAAQAVRDPGLLLDRQFFNEMTRKHDRYKRLFLASERGL